MWLDVERMTFRKSANFSLIVQAPSVAISAVTTEVHYLLPCVSISVNLSLMTLTASACHFVTISGRGMFQPMNNPTTNQINDFIIDDLISRYLPTVPTKHDAAEHFYQRGQFLFATDNIRKQVQGL